jgi:hypothetical protein
VSAFISKYGVAVHVYIPVIKRGVVDFAVSADWTPAAGDVKVSKDGGAAANVTNLPTAITMGNTAMWDFSMTATEMQAAKVMVTIADSATKAVEDSMFTIWTHGNASGQYQVDLADSVRAGLTALPNAAAEAAGGLYTRGSGAGQINQPANGQIDANTVKVSGTAQTARDLGASVLLSSGTGTGQISLSSGAVLLQATQTGVTIPTVTTVGSVSGSVGSVTGAVGSVTGAVGSVTGNVGGNVVGSVGSVTGAVGSVTGNVGGNVVGSVASVTAAVATTSNVKKNQALSNFQFLMTDSTNHAPATGKTVTVTRGIDNGSQASGTLSAVTEISNGLYRVDFGAGDLNGNVITLRATASGCDDTFERIVTQP